MGKIKDSLIPEEENMPQQEHTVEGIFLYNFKTKLPLFEQQVDNLSSKTLKSLIKTLIREYKYVSFGRKKQNA